MLLALFPFLRGGVHGYCGQKIKKKSLVSMIIYNSFFIFLVRMIAKEDTHSFAGFQVLSVILFSSTS